MQAPIIPMIQYAPLDDAQREPLGLTTAASSLSLRRAWPRSDDHLTMEYLSTDGQLVAGHWMRSPDALLAFASASRHAVPGGHTCVIESPAGPIFLQAQGTDSALPSLHRFLVSRPSKLVSIRPERRAVVLTNARDQPVFVKFFRSARHTREAIALGDVLAGAPVAFARPSLIDANLHEHWLAWSVVAGKSWSSVLKRDEPQFADDGESVLDVSFRVGEALRTLHTSIPPANLRVHTPTDERLVLERWLRQSSAFGVETRDLASQAERAIQMLEGAEWTPVLIHRDFHDRQVLIAADSAIGFIDFDTLSLGDPALDLGNAIAHIERCGSGLSADARTHAAEVKAFLQGYADSDLLTRVEAWRILSRLRTQCIHAFRPDAE